MTRPAGSTFLDGRVTLIAQPTFQPAQLGQVEAIRACASAAGSGKGSIFFPVETLAKDDFSLYKQGLREREFLLIVSKQ